MLMKFFEQKHTPFVLLFLIVLLSRLPFLWAGYGIEEDSWAIAISTYFTKITGIVETSRLPGHPVHEFPLVWLWNGGYQVSNLLSAIFSAIGVVMFGLILKHFSFKYYFVAALAFAFIPVYYVSSTYTIDFVFSETYVLIAMYFLLQEKYYLIGIFLGLAVGCRITSGVMIIPFLIMLFDKNNLKQLIYTALKIGIPMAVVSGFSFLPIFLRYGTGFFMYYDQFPYPSIPKFFYKLIPGVWGFTGTITLLSAKIYYFCNRKQIKSGALFEKKIDKKVVIASFIIIGLYIISYLRLPQKSGYMIPTLPFVIILAGYYLDSRMFKTVCVGLILSPFIFSINLTDKYRGAVYSALSIKFNVSGQEIFFDPISGPIFSDYSKRKQKLKYTDAVIKKVSDITEKSVIIAGWWYNEIEVKMLYLNKNQNVNYEAYINEEKIKSYTQKGYRIYYLPEQDKYNDLMFKISCTNDYASPFEVNY